ncbi:uncharacterized protein LOC104583669 [Brachypodium distachyon]|uniref:Uncharacterized protein n=1 Tax=Brachypodium distachyon TaxID=15368 RepID=A0A2K2CZS3_BRADI|nr:uncharacterized protein LOC104583669 [Brachypodium distachyon]PNT67526.1 hypothetical protein BRADI_3g28540v3 [Brachypodium distachyon]|eukprot:XP_010234807.1 uncharacterized protein LOC104583669 [Brachypodium distachyon]
MEVPRGPWRKRKGKDAAGAGPAVPAADAGDRNRLLAGYLAHEFLARGTVRGERRAAGGPGTGSEAGQEQAFVRYEALAALVQHGGARVPGVVNPAQLAAWAAATTR